MTGDAVVGAERSVGDMLQIPLFVNGMSEAELSAARNLLESSSGTTGPEVGRFEAELASHFGTSSVFATSSCTAALHLAMLALGIGPGDEVITTPLTFPATANAIMLTGATPVFCDVDTRTLNLDPRRIAELVTSRTKAILPVHLGGLPVDMDGVTRVAAAHGLFVVVDAAHAVASTYMGRHVASYGDIVCFSFYATKNLSTVEGGALTGRDDLVARARLLGRHGLEFEWDDMSPGVARRYRPVAVGLKYNMSDLQAAIGRVQLGRLPALQERRQLVASAYARTLGGISSVVLVGSGATQGDNGWYLYQVLLSESVDVEEVRDGLRRVGVATGRFYPPLHLYDLYAARSRWLSLQVAETSYRRLLALPINPAMDVALADYVVEALLRLSQPS